MHIPILPVEAGPLSEECKNHRPEGELVSGSPDCSLGDYLSEVGEEGENQVQHKKQLLKNTKG